MVSLQNLLSNKDAISKEMCERKLEKYIQHAWPVIEPGTPYLSNWHIGCIAEHLEACLSGQILRLIINMPPRNMKSICTTVTFPTWAWIKDPARRIFTASYAQNLSTKHSIDRRTIIRSEWYQNNWGDKFQLKDDKNQKMEFGNNHEGVMIATSVGGSATGKGGGILIVDDPHNPTEAMSDTQRQHAIDWFKNTFYTRLDNKKTGVIIVVMQRLHEEDLTGHILHNDELSGQGDWVHLCLQGQEERGSTIYFPMSGRTVERKPGDYLWPEREGKKEHDQAKVMLGEYGYSGQYQQNPSPDEGGYFKKSYWRFWWPIGAKVPPPIKVKCEDGSFHECAQIQLPPEIVIKDKAYSWDMTFKDLKTSDYVVGQLWARDRARKFLLDQVRGQWSFTKALDEFKEFSKLYPYIPKLVEDKANGTAIMDTIKDEIAGVDGVDPSGSKVARAQSVGPTIRAGDVYLPHPHFFPWVNKYIDEFAKFPNSKKDDQVDATSQILNYWQAEGNQSVSELSSVNRPSRKTLSGSVGNKW